MEISIVSPVYKAEKIISELVSRIVASVEMITSDFEVILVEDCGPDNSWAKIIEECKKDSRIKGIKLSRNFGQHHAITTGLDSSKGNWIVVMDCDLQDRPEEIINLYREVKKGFDIVYARRIQRQDNFLKRITSYLFYKIFSYLSGEKLDGTISNFGIYSRKVIDNVNSLREAFRIFSAMVRWVGFKYTTINVKHGKRYEGRTSYNWNKLIEFGLDYAISFSQKPLKIAIKLGLIISCVSLVYTLYVIKKYFEGRITEPGYTSLIISIWFLSGLIIFTLGIIGLYVGKTFEGIKKRPIYIIENKINL